MVLTKKIDDINNGTMDTYFLEEVKKTKNQPIVKNEYKQVSETKYVHIKNKFTPNYDNEYKYFQKINDSVPDYIRYNLKGMPNNKGYIWKNSWLFGELPSEKNSPIVLFEKYKNVMYIHEYTYNEYKLFIKEGYNQKYLAKHEIRTKKKSL